MTEIQSLNYRDGAGPPHDAGTECEGEYLWRLTTIPRTGPACCSSVRTRFDFHLKQRRIEKMILVGMAANTCIEATARGGAELGYHVTLVRDATAAFSPEAMQAALDLNGPTFAHAILTTDAVIAALVNA